MGGDIMDDVVVNADGDDPGEVVVAIVHEDGSYEPFSFEEMRRVPDGAQFIEVRKLTIGTAVRRAKLLLKSRDGVAYIATLSDYRDAEQGSVDPEDADEYTELMLRIYLA